MEQEFNKKGEKMKPFKMNDLQQMMSNIISESQEEVFKTIDKINNPISRAKERKLFHQALIKLKGKK